MVVKAGIVIGDTLWEPSLASWFFTIKSEEGNKATFFHWPRLDTLFASQAWILLRRLPEAKASKTTVLRVRCSRSVSFIGSKSAFMSSLRQTERFHFGRFLEHFRRSLWKLESNLLRSELWEIWCPVGPKVSMVERRLFKSWYSYMKNSENCFTEGVEKSTEFSLHHFSNRSHFDL